MRVACLALTFISLAKTALGGDGSCDCNPTNQVTGGVYCAVQGGGLCWCYNSYNSDYVDCTYSTCCSGYSARNVPQVDISQVVNRPPELDDGRRLEAHYEEGHVDVFGEGDEAKYKDLVDKCGHHDYETALYVDEHLYAIASPTKEAEAADCPYVVLHSKFGDGDAGPKKEAMVFHKTQDGKVYVEGKEVYPMGTFKASALVNAAEVSEAGMDTGFDVLNNNCAIYMVNLASNLGIKIDTGVTSYVAKRLLQDAGSGLLQKIKSSVGFHKRNLRADMTDQELINNVVEQQAAHLMA